MPDTQFVLMTGRSTRQGKSLHLGKEAKECREEVSTFKSRDGNGAPAPAGRG